MESLFATAPGFDQPLAVLKHCHDRIRRQLTTLEKLPEHLANNGADAAAQQAAIAVLRYFTQAAPLHHDDEEIDLLPSLQASAGPEEQTLLAQLLPMILQQHQEMSALWQELKTSLEAIAEMKNQTLPVNALNRFKQLYHAHMQIEEEQIAPMAARVLSTEQLQRIGTAMQVRRGIKPHGI